MYRRILIALMGALLMSGAFADQLIGDGQMQAGDICRAVLPDTQPSWVCLRPSPLDFTNFMTQAQALAYCGADPAYTMYQEFGSSNWRDEPCGTGPDVEYNLSWTAPLRYESGNLITDPVEYEVTVDGNVVAITDFTYATLQLAQGAHVIDVKAYVPNTQSYASGNATIVVTN